MMDPYKLQRQNSAIHKVLSDVISSEIKDPRVGFVTVNGVELNRDQTVARVFFSDLGGEEAGSLAGLKKARGFLQRRLNDVLRMRAVPDLRFVYDASIDRSIGVEEILRDLVESGGLDAEADRKRRMVLADFEPPADLMAALENGRSFWLVPHWNPDPDAMGSCLALAEALRLTGRDALVFGFPDPPLGFVALPGIEDVLPAAEAPELLAEDPPDTLLMMDCHRRERAGDDLADTLARIENAWTVDHHLLSGRMLPLPGWVEPAASATAMLTMRIIEDLLSKFVPDSPDLPADIAANLYAGLVSDTGGFRFTNTLPATFEAAGLLARRGIDTADVAERTLYQRSRAGVELLRLVMGTFSYEADGRLLLMTATRDMLRQAGATMVDTESFVSVATAVAGVEYVVFMKELEDGLWRVSLRCGAGGDVQVIAAHYGGGGHRQAAGCTIAGEVEAVAATMRDSVLGQLNP